MHADENRINRITEKVIGAAFRVGNALGYGFLEKVYANAVVHELGKTGLKVRPQYPVPVYDDGVTVGDFVCDLLVEDIVLVELKSVRGWNDIHTTQCLNYLTATKLPLCLLINFGPRVEIKRYANVRPGP